jgi:hypothetical protein
MLACRQVYTVCTQCTADVLTQRSAKHEPHACHLHQYVYPVSPSYYSLVAAAARSAAASPPTPHEKTNPAGTASVALIPCRCFGPSCTCPYPTQPLLPKSLFPLPLPFASSTFSCYTAAAPAATPLQHLLLLLPLPSSTCWSCCPSPPAPAAPAAPPLQHLLVLLPVAAAACRDELSVGMSITRYALQCCFRCCAAHGPCEGNQDFLLNRSIPLQ